MLIILTIDMNIMIIKVYGRVLKETCEKYGGAEDFINDRIEEVCSHEKLSVEKVIFFLLASYYSCFHVSFFIKA